MRTYEFQSHSMLGWIKMILGIHSNLQVSAEQQQRITLQAVITMDYIWQLRNKNRLEEQVIEPLQEVEAIKTRIHGHGYGSATPLISPHGRCQLESIYSRMMQLIANPARS